MLLRAAIQASAKGRATTAGSFEMFLDGSTVGLDVSSEDEDIDAIAVTPEGKLVISTQGTARVPGPTGELVVNESSMMQLENNQFWTLYLKGSAFGLNQLGKFPSEDLNAASVDGEGIHLSTVGTFSISGTNSQGQSFTLNGDGSDIFTCVPETLGSNTKMSNCTMRFDGSANGFGGQVIDAFSIGRSGVMGSSFSDDEDVVEAPDGQDDVAVEEQQIFLPLITR